MTRRYSPRAGPAGRAATLRSSCAFEGARTTLGALLLLALFARVESALPVAQINLYSIKSEFLEIAHDCGTDKVTIHNYDSMYDQYLGPLRDRPLKILEIGLGCNMDYGPGHSLCVWTKYLPNAEVWFAEYDGACVDKFMGSQPELRARILVGDQADWATLAEWVEQAGDGFDVIIDDGGHRNPQILNSFYALFYNALRPGGLYFIEDIQCSFFEEWWEPRTYSVARVLSHWSELATLTPPHKPCHRAYYTDPLDIPFRNPSNPDPHRDHWRLDHIAERAKVPYAAMPPMKQDTEAFPVLSDSPRDELFAPDRLPPKIKSIHCSRQMCMIHKCEPEDGRCCHEQ